jgi:proprotein convertase subtilisin/kexin type 5
MGVVSDWYTCLNCPKECKTCSRELTCNSCEESHSVHLEEGKCVCDDTNKYYDGESCESCHLSCSTCDGPDVDDCLSCHSGALLQQNLGEESGHCICLNNEKMDTDG